MRVLEARLNMSRSHHYIAISFKSRRQSKNFREGKCRKIIMYVLISASIRNSFYSVKAVWQRIHITVLSKVDTDNARPIRRLKASYMKIHNDDLFIHR